MNYRAERQKCERDHVSVKNGIDNWPDGQGGLEIVDKCALTGSRCHFDHCPKMINHPRSHFDVLEKAGLTKQYEEEMEI